MKRRLRDWIQQVTPPVLFRGLRRLALALSSSGEKSEAWYDRVYEGEAGYLCHYTESPYYFLWAVIADRMRRSGVRRVLDLGCGPGQFASLLQDQGIVDYCGIDLSPRAIARAKRLCPSYSFVVADLCRTDLSDFGEYDCVVACEFLEHVEPDLAILERIKPGVRFFGSVPNNPYISHVRYFRNAQEVRDRYGAFFADLTVDAFLRDSHGLVIYLIEGMTRERTIR